MTNPFIGRGLTVNDKPREVEFILDGFLGKEVITLYYAPPKSGKSILAFALSRYAHDIAGMRVLYFDFDNSLVALENRKVFGNLPAMKQYDYIHMDKIAMTRDKVLQELMQFAKQPGKPLENYFLVFDSLTDFTDTNEHNAKIFMGKMKALRAAGATILILHHMNKSERSYQGAQDFVSAADNSFSLEMPVSGETNPFSVFTMEKYLSRLKGIKNTAYSVANGVFTLESIPYSEAIIPQSEQAFIDETIKIIKKQPGIKQGELLKQVGKDAGNKNGKILLDKYKGRCWVTESGSKNAILYYLP